jgi:hypothetical protein
METLREYDDRNMKYSSLGLAVLLMACAAPVPPRKSPQRTFEVTCPVTTVEAVRDTVAAVSYGYFSSRLVVYHSDERYDNTVEYPSNCVIKQIK